MQIRPEHPEDVDTIRSLMASGFKDTPYSSHTEAAIIDALRSADELTLSLVATQNDEIVGHVAFSPVRINGEAKGWYGLGPISVWPQHQKSGKDRH
jgi:putative acetyltransferase